MIESCSRKRMITMIAILLVCTSIILLFEEYVEDTEFETSKIFKKFAKLEDFVGKSSDTKKQNTTDSKNKTITDVNKLQKERSRCEANEKSILIKSCVACSKQEILKAEYCAQTGFYNLFECAPSKRSFHSACLSRNAMASNLMNFQIFSLASLASAIIFGGFVKWRKSLVGQRAYTRLPQSAAPNSQS